MCNNTSEQLWQGFAASVPGSGHIRREIPCQDASAVILSPRTALIVCDGRGSAKLSHFGARQAVKAFRTQCAVMEPFLVNILDSEKEEHEQWQKFCQIMYRTLAQAKLELAEEHNEPEKEFDFTVAFAITGTHHIGTFQVGDGAIVLCQEGVCQTAFSLEKGEFANQTQFLRAGGEVKLKFQAKLFPSALNSGIAATSDGPEHLMFKLPEMTPGKIFDAMFNDMRAGSFCRQDLLDFLTNRKWNDDPRGTDDRSLAILTPVLEEKSAGEPDENEEEDLPVTENSEESHAPAEPLEVKVPADTPADTPAEAEPVSSVHAHCVRGREKSRRFKKKMLKPLLLLAAAGMLAAGIASVKELAADFSAKLVSVEQANRQILHELHQLRKLCTGTAASEIRNGGKNGSAVRTASGTSKSGK